MYQNRFSIQYELPAEFVEAGIESATLEELQEMLKRETKNERFELCKKIQEAIDKKR